MRILYVGDPPLAVSGYGQQAALLLPRLRADGHDVAIMPVGASHGATYQDASGMTVYPTVADLRGGDVVGLHALDHRADVVLTLGDPHAFDPEAYGRLPWCMWALLDFESPTAATMRSLRRARWVWCPSRHGVREFGVAGVQARYVPHGVDSSVFCDQEQLMQSARARVSARIGVDLMHSSLTVAVAANKSTPSRKGFFEMLSAFKLFSDARRGAVLYLHTDSQGIGGGEDLRDIMRLVGLDARRVIFPDPYLYATGRIKPDYLADVYRAADVFLSTSHSEGFGLPSVEAQMCGCPAILPKNSAQEEMCFDGSSLVGADAYHPFDGATLWKRPRVGEVVEVLHKYAASGVFVDRAALSARARRFDADTVYREHVLPALAKIESDIRGAR